MNILVNARTKHMMGTNKGDHHKVPLTVNLIPTHHAEFKTEQDIGFNIAFNNGEHFNRF